MNNLFTSDEKDVIVQLLSKINVSPIHPDYFKIGEQVKGIMTKLEALTEKPAEAKPVKPAKK